MSPRGIACRLCGNHNIGRCLKLYENVKITKPWVFPLGPYLRPKLWANLKGLSYEPNIRDRSNPRFCSANLKVPINGLSQTQFHFLYKYTDILYPDNYNLEVIVLDNKTHLRVKKMYFALLLFQAAKANFWKEPSIFLSWFSSK